MKYRKTARPLSFLVASLLAFQPVTALAVTFADMNQVPWPGAEVSINKAADLGLVVGETKNGKAYFRPRDTVSLSESCQFAYKVLLQTKKASADSSVTEKWKAVLNTYKIQDWAHPAVSFCLENGIVSISDLSGFVKNGSNMPASREQAAEILGRALTVGIPSYKADASTTMFVDNASISADARPYIALLNEVKIVNGDDTNRFNPKKTLNRTETAVMVTNLYEKLNSTATPVAPSVSTSTVSGTVKDITLFYVNFDGSAAYYLYSSSGAVATLNGESTTVDKLVTLFKDGAEMKATLTLDGNTRITKLAVTAEETEEDDDSKKATEGKLTAVKYDEEDDNGSITINSKSTYKIKEARDVDIEIDGDDYDLEELKDLYDDCKEDDKVIEVKLSFNSKDELTKIKGTIEDAEDEDDDDAYTKRGELTDVDYDEDKEEGDIELDGEDTYYWDDKTKIYIDGEKSDWEDLLDLFDEAEDENEDLEAKLTLEDEDEEDVTKIEVFTEDYENEDEDELDGIKVEEVKYSRDKGTGSIKLDGKKYNLDEDEIDDMEVEITDGDSEIDDFKGLYDAYDDNKEIMVDVVLDDGDVIEITGYVCYVSGRLVSYDDESLTIEGKDSGTEVTYEFEKPNKISMKKFTGKSFETLEKLIEELDEMDEDDDLDLSDEDYFKLQFEVDEDGMIKGDISGKYEKDK